MKPHSLLPALLIATCPLLAALLPVKNAGGPEAQLYGQTEHYPTGSSSTLFERKYLVGAFSHFDTLFPAHTINASTKPWNFHISADSPEIRYAHAGEHYLITDYLNHLPVTGLLIAKDDQILFEAYQYDRTPEERLTSQSMAKTIVAMLFGIAVSDHAIGSLEDTAGQYVAELKGSPYGSSKLIDLLHMSSGVICQSSDTNESEIEAGNLRTGCKQAFAAGKHFHYSAADTQVLGLVLSNAVHKNLSTYLEEKIWSQIGTTSKASWTADSSGHDLAFCCFNATLRDYAHFARLLAFDGVWNGKQLIPKDWILQATTVSDATPQLAPGQPAPFFGYGYQVWILPGQRRTFALIGANGQRIFVDPQSKLILVQTAVMEKPMDRPKDAETIGLWLSLIHHYGEK
jgi:CubicO group peptidase (beta-lactamase class C family)